MGGAVVTEEYRFVDEHQVWLQIGSQQIPEYPINSVAEAYYQLKKAVGKSFHIFGRWFRCRRYIIGLDCEKISGAGFTGINTKAGDLLTVNFRHCDASGIANIVPHRVYCALHYDCVMNISDNGIQVLD